MSVKIIAFYEFKDFGHGVEDLKPRLKSMMTENEIRGTIIIAREGYNGMVCGAESDVDVFVRQLESLFETNLVIKSSFADVPPFRKVEVKIKGEIVTLKKEVDVSLGSGTHVRAEAWNDLISDPSVYLLDARNDYEYRTGTFQRAVNPETEKFSDLPQFVAENLDPERHKRVAMFCTGGIRCEKFAPYVKSLGFEEVFQLEGGILKYLEETPPEESLWQGECFVFDERRTVDAKLETGSGVDMSLRTEKRQKAKYKL